MAIIEPKGVLYNKKQTEYQLFPEEYFSSADCYVYFNDVWLDELTGLTFELREVVRPIYGYSSNTWDYVARGQRYVQGQFSIAFKEAGYMWTILDHIGQLGTNVKAGIGYLLNEDKGALPSKTVGNILERIEDTLDRNHGTGEEASSSRMTMYEKEIWGRPFVEDAEAVRKQDSFFYRTRKRENFKEGVTQALFQDGFDIYINYGPFPQYIQSKLGKIGNDITFNSTVKAIRNVQITDVSQMIDATTGEPIKEVYSFIAKDLD